MAQITDPGSPFPCHNPSTVALACDTTTNNHHTAPEWSSLSSVVLRSPASSAVFGGPQLSLVVIGGSRHPQLSSVALSCPRWSSVVLSGPPRFSEVLGEPRSAGQLGSTPARLQPVGRPVTAAAAGYFCLAPVPGGSRGPGTRPLGLVSCHQGRQVTRISGPNTPATYLTHVFYIFASVK